MSIVAIEPKLDADGLRQVFLEPGALYCGTEPTVVRTVLGSCVAVCLFDRYGRAGGMNHYVLPNSPAGPPSLRYGDVSIEQLIIRICRLGCPMGDLRAKVFGGAAVLPFGAAEDTVGTKNVSIALDLLRSRSIPVLARRTGGPNGLLIRLYTANGSVMVRPIVHAAERAGDGLIPIFSSEHENPPLRRGRHIGDILAPVLPGH
jgi:chemotaxis protein CheD